MSVYVPVSPVCLWVCASVCVCVPRPAGAVVKVANPLSTWLGPVWIQPGQRSTSVSHAQTKLVEASALWIDIAFKIWPVYDTCKPRPNKAWVLLWKILNKSQHKVKMLVCNLKRLAFQVKTAQGKSERLDWQKLGKCYVPGFMLTSLCSWCAASNQEKSNCWLNVAQVAPPVGQGPDQTPWNLAQ